MNQPALPFGGRVVQVDRDPTAPSRCAAEGCPRCTTDQRPPALWSFSVLVGGRIHGPFGGYHFDVARLAEAWRPLAEGA